MSELDDCIPAETDVEQVIEELVLVEALNRFLRGQPKQKRNIVGIGISIQYGK